MEMQDGIRKAFFHFHLLADFFAQGWGADRLLPCWRLNIRAPWRSIPKGIVGLSVD
jgi:hypothetical protein